ncbi:NUDIX hydrolase [Acetobacter persici]|uniref:NUDIX hydrolase n=1 Tax=Acetobacter persici TaxID=1076596 RepID=UPI001BABFECE|nr:NUDIX domain-containing protein [Acetobacter persici]MBS0964072.1 NUDIX domain-containing protein [Acetobacter persici]
MREPRLGCGALILQEGSILLLRRLRAPEAGCWGLPGGKVDAFETVPAAVAREVLEETGLVIHQPALLCVVDQIDAVAGTHWVAPVYTVSGFTGQARVQEPHKHGGLDWFPLTALPAPLTHATTMALAALREKTGG